MCGVRVFVAQNFCLLYLSISSCILMLCKIFWGEFEIFFLGGGLPPDVPRINTGIFRLNISPPVSMAPEPIHSGSN